VTDPDAFAQLVGLAKAALPPTPGPTASSGSSSGSSSPTSSSSDEATPVADEPVAETVDAS
jgi:hypothetical protein